MADENAPKSAPPPAEGPTAATVDARALNELRKEVVEARNLIIKTDNLLKNMHAELKKFGDCQEEFSRRRFWSSAAAYVLFATFAVVGAVVVARTEVGREREAVALAETRAKTEQAKAEVALKQVHDRKEATDRAKLVYDQLSSEKEGPGLTQAITNAARIDRSLLSPLESRSIDDWLSQLRERVAASALEKGQAAAKRGDNKTTSEELGRYLELTPNAADPQLWFHLGYARALLKDQAGAIEPLEKFLKLQAQGKLAQLAGYYLGIAYEETGAIAKASEAYTKAASLFPGSELAPSIRQHLRKLPAPGTAAPAAPGKPGTAPAPAPGSAPAPR